MPRPKRNRIEPPGGHRQREQWAREEEDSTVLAPESNLLILLVSLWSWGSLSAPMLQKICMAAQQDGHPHPDVARAAKLGKSCEFPRNCHRDLVNMLNLPPISQSLSKIWLPQKVSAVAKEWIEQTILLPHSLFACLFKYHKKAFLIRMLGGSAGNVKKFWDSMRQHPAIDNHPMKDKDNWETTTVPITLHGDGMPVSGVGKTWSKAVEVILCVCLNVHHYPPHPPGCLLS